MSNQDVLNHSDVIVLGIRPQIARDVLSELRFGRGHRVISLIAGLSLRSVAALVEPAAKVTRAVPLPAVAVRQGATAIYPPDQVVADLFVTLGIAFEVGREHEFDARSTAIATIASYFAFADSISSWLVSQGVPKDKATEYVARISCGLGNAAIDVRNQSLASLAGDHATHGGINQQLLSHLTAHGDFDNLSAGLDGVMRRMTTN